jgi:integrase
LVGAQYFSSNVPANFQEAVVYCGLSARIGADQLGHARPSMTQDVYMNRGKIHTEVASVLDRVAGINDE